MQQRAHSSAESLLTVDDLLTTAELAHRPKRLTHDRAIGSALQLLSRQITDHPSEVLPLFVALAQKLCGGGSAGISVYEPQPERAGIFRWHALTGKAAPFTGETTPRDFSPCGVCLDKGETILMDRPGRYYDWLNLPGVPLTEALLVPLMIHGKQPFGTLWIMSHDEHQFDGEDARVLSEMASVVGLALGMMADIADRDTLLKQSREALFQSTKLEALGQLTGGIAHDFNNLLTVLTGQLELIGDRVQDDQLRKMVAGGLKATARGEKLVQYLMAFARRQPLQPNIIDIRPVLTEIVETLRRAFAASLTIESRVADDLWPVLVDPNQLESAILNLAINARDAMSADGNLTVEARNAHLRDESPCDGLTGDFIMIAVSDTGSGMSPEVSKKAFEPFFTTKSVGLGTGLGLSMAHDFAALSGGKAEIRSELGKGTSVTLYLPRTMLDQ